MLKKAAKANEEFAQLIGKLVMSPPVSSWPVLLTDLQARLAGICLRITQTCSVLTQNAQLHQKPVDRPSLPKLSNLLRIRPSEGPTFHPMPDCWPGPNVWEPGYSRCGERAQISAHLRVNTQAGQRGLLEG